MFQDISIPSSSPSSLLAAREWVERNIQNGVLTYPIKVALIEQEESHDANYGQVFLLIRVILRMQWLRLGRYFSDAPGVHPFRREHQEGIIAFDKYSDMQLE